MEYPNAEVSMHTCRFAFGICLLAALPSPGSAQDHDSRPVRPAVFAQLQDRQWVRLAGPEIGRRQGRVTGHSPTELMLAGETEPLRVPATAVDTVWTRGRHTVAGLIVGAILLGVLGAAAGTELGEENAGSAPNVLGMAGGGALGGALIGAAIGTAIPRWRLRFP
jgi:hypothetical protein